MATDCKEILPTNDNDGNHAAAANGVMRFELVTVPWARNGNNLGDASHMYVSCITELHHGDWKRLCCRAQGLRGVP